MQNLTILRDVHSRLYCWAPSQMEVKRGAPVWLNLPNPLSRAGFSSVNLELRHFNEVEHPECIVHCECTEKKEGKPTEKHQGTVAAFSPFAWEVLGSDGHITYETNARGTREDGTRAVTIQGVATRLKLRFKAFSSCHKSKFILRP